MECAAGGTGKPIPYDKPDDLQGTGLPVPKNALKRAEATVLASAVFDAA